MPKPKIDWPGLVVFASGTEKGGGSGFENLVQSSRRGELKARIITVVSNHQAGGVYKRAKALETRFVHFPPPYTAERYQQIVKAIGADFTALSGWLKLVEGLDPRTTFNIHPGLLPEFGGPGMYGHYVHQAVYEAFMAGDLTHTAVSMHFVTKEYDKGPVFFRKPVRINAEDTPESIGHNVNAVEHAFQPVITNLVVNGFISWDGKDPRSLRVPSGYEHL